MIDGEGKWAVVPTLGDAVRVEAFCTGTALPRVLVEFRAPGKDEGPRVTLDRAQVQELLHDLVEALVTAERESTQRFALHAAKGGEDESSAADPCPRCGTDWNRDYNPECSTCMEDSPV